MFRAASSIRVVYQFPIRLGKSTLIPGNIDVNWTPSCSAGAEDYGIYQGRIGNWTSHRQMTCTDPSPAFTEVVTPQNADSYYMVVPHNYSEEGSYGRDYIAGVETERPQPLLLGDRCVPPQVLTPVHNREARGRVPTRTVPEPTNAVLETKSFRQLEFRRLALPRLRNPPPGVILSSLERASALWSSVSKSVKKWHFTFRKLLTRIRFGRIFMGV